MMGSDVLNLGKSLYIVFIFSIIVSLLWLTANTTASQVAQFYTMFGGLAIPFLAIDWLIKRRMEIIDSVTYEPRETRPPIFNALPNIVLVILGVILVLFLFFNVSSTKYSLVSAPLFQAVQLQGNIYLQAILSGMAGIMENVVFFALIFPTSVSLLIFFFRIPRSFALLFGIILSSSIFASFHWAVYGLTNFNALASTFIFALINCILIYLFRNMFLTDIFHFANNFFVVIFKTMRVGFVVLGLT